MDTVTATHLKRRLGEVLDAVSFRPVAVERHGRVVAYLVSPSAVSPRKPSPSARRPDATTRWGRRDEERLVELCAARDFRPSRWARAGDPWFLAGVAATLASLPQFDRPRMLALAERLHPGMSGKDAFERWLAEAPLDPVRFLPLLTARMEMDLEAKGA